MKNALAYSSILLQLHLYLQTRRYGIILIVLLLYISVLLLYISVLLLYLHETVWKQSQERRRLMVLGLKRMTTSNGTMNLINMTII